MLYRTLLRPILFRLPPETVHELALDSLPFFLGPRVARDLIARRFFRSPFGPLQRFGLTFQNPVGLAAGFDKDGVALPALAALGFGFIEAGTVTSLPQPGNPRPRLFRLPLDQGLINRAGFNNHGSAALAERLKQHRPQCVLGVSIGKSKLASDAVADYLESFTRVHPVADYIAVNISSPNTPGLRELQRADQLETLLQALDKRNNELGVPVPLLVKLAPDLEIAELELIVDVCGRTNVAGIIATNTTVSRAGLRTPPLEIEAHGQGGLSGAPLRRRATAMIASLYRLTRGRIPLIGVGGIFNATDAWEKICAGAGLVQLYTGFIYQGPDVAMRINDGLAEIVRREGFASLDDAVGSKAEARREP